MSTVAIRIGKYLYLAAVMAFLIAPIAIIAVASFGPHPMLEFPPSSFSLKWYESFFQNREWYEASINSVYIALGVSALGCTLALCAALAGSTFSITGANLVEALVTLPIVVPSLVLAIAILMIMPLVGLSSGLAGIVTGHIILVVPVAYLIIVGALRSIDRNLELAARSLGAGWAASKSRVLFPLLWPAIANAILLGFLVSFDDAIFAIFLGGPGTTTLPKKMWESMRFEMDPTLTAISTIITGLVLALTILSAFVFDRKKKDT